MVGMILLVVILMIYFLFMREDTVDCTTFTLCKKDKDCKKDETCTIGLCVPDVCDLSECNKNKDCPKDQVCVDVFGIKYCMDQV